MKHSVKCAILAASLIISTFAFAQPQQDRSTELLGVKFDYFSAGVGVVLSDKPYKGMDNELYVIPLIDLRIEKFYMQGPKLGYELWQDEGFTFEAIAQYRFDGYDDSDASAVSGMDDRDHTIDYGLGLKYDMKEWGQIGIEWLADLMDNHNGQEIEVRYSYDWRQDQLTLTPFVGFSWLSDNIIDYYYGVRPGEVRAGRAAYEGRDTINWFTGLTVRYTIDQRWSLFSMFNWEFYGDEISDSPIVDDDSGMSGLFGVMYNF